ncbi:MAG: YbaK/EbsC family protein [Chloroflexi bacterium]|nr:YbaK/EbsC family protein [Chloroflexota bacterium]
MGEDAAARLLPRPCPGRVADHLRVRRLSRSRRAGCARPAARHRARAGRGPLLEVGRDRRRARRRGERLGPRRPGAHRARAAADRAGHRALRPLSGPDHPNIERVRAHASACGVELPVKRFSGTTRTAEDAAREIGCGVAEIVKSLVFVADGSPVVVCCSGAQRVDEQRLAAALGASRVRRSTADEAKDATGFPIGGIPPFAHATPCRVLVDRGLLAYETVWAAAGLHDAVFPIAPAELVRLAGATLADVAV